MNWINRAYDAVVDCLQNLPVATATTPVACSRTEIQDKILQEEKNIL
jgi:hypothetical protein